MLVMVGNSFSLLHTNYSSIILRLSRDLSVPTRFILDSNWNANRSRLMCPHSLVLRPCCEWLWTVYRTWRVSPCVSRVLRPCCGETHATHATQRDSHAILYTPPYGTVATVYVRITTSQIFTIFYQLIAGLVVVMVSRLRIITSYDNRYKRAVHPSAPLYKCVIDLTPVIAMVVVF